MCVSLKIIPIAVHGDRACFVYADLSVSKEISSAHAGACLDANGEHSTLPVGIFPGSQPKRTHRGGDLKETSQTSRGNTTGIQIAPGGLGMLIFLKFPKRCSFSFVRTVTPCSWAHDVLRSKVPGAEGQGTGKQNQLSCQWLFVGLVAIKS